MFSSFMTWLKGFFTTTVDAIEADFQKVVSQLEALSQHHTAVAKTAQQTADHNAKQAAKANKIKTNIQKNILS